MSGERERHVVFGTGPLGLAVMRELVRRGRSVRMVNRSGRAEVPDGVEVAAADACDPHATRAVCANAEVVYQCAQPPYATWPARFPVLQASILEGAAANGARLVIGDNLYMYGDVAGPIHEGLPYAATTRKGRARAEMARAALDLHKIGKLPVTIGRGSDFFGPHVLSSVLGGRVFPAVIRGGRASCVGDPDVPHTFTYIEDFGRALVVLGERPEALGQAWHVPNPETRTTREIVAMAFEAAGHPPQVSGMGRWMMRLGGIFIPEARETVEMMYQFEKPFFVDHSKYERTFGEKATPLREAVRQTVEWFRTLSPGPSGS